MSESSLEHSTATDNCYPKDSLEDNQSHNISDWFFPQVLFFFAV